MDLPQTDSSQLICILVYFVTKAAAWSRPILHALRERIIRDLRKPTRRQRSGHIQRRKK